jgi:hypothetical protein
MPEYPTNKDNDVSLLKKIADNTAEIAEGSGGGGGIGAVDSVNGQTGVVVLDKSDVGLSNADNTSDANKPVSSATQTALDLKADVVDLDTLQEQVDSLPTGEPSSTGNALISGGGVAQDTGLNIVVSAAEYRIQGVGYTSPQAALSLAAADGTNPRIDVVALNAAGAAVIITGTAAATPAKPDVDPTTQLELTFLVVAAAASAPTVVKTNIYLENTEYTMTNPRSGTKDIEATAMVATDYFQAQAGGNLDLANYNNLVFFIRSKASWPNQKQLTITARATGVTVGSPITFKHGSFGFDSSITGSYQAVVIPCNLFGADGQSVNQIRWTCQGGGAAIGFYMDDVSFQGGISTAADSTRLRPRGDYSADLLYEINDAVLSGGFMWVSIKSGVGNTPASSPTYWKKYALVSGAITGSGLTMATARLLGRTTASTGALEEITVGSGLSLSAGSLSATGGSGTKTLCRWGALDCIQPAANYATFNTRNVRPVMEFDDTTDESVILWGVIPQGADLSSGIKRREFWKGKTATTGNFISTGAFERGNTDSDADSFATGIDSAATAVSGTSGITTVVETNHTSSEIDGITVGDDFYLKLTRKASSGSDTVTGDMQLVGVEIQQIA